MALEEAVGAVRCAGGGPALFGDFKEDCEVETSGFFVLEAEGAPIPVRVELVVPDIFVAGPVACGKEALFSLEFAIF